MIVVTDLEGADWPLPLHYLPNGALIAAFRAASLSELMTNALGAGVLVQDEHGVMDNRHISTTPPWQEVLTWTTDSDTGAQVPDQIDSRVSMNVIMGQPLVGDPVGWVWWGDPAQHLPRYQQPDSATAWQTWAVFYAKNGGPVLQPNKAEQGVTLGSITMMDYGSFASPTNRLAGF